MGICQSCGMPLGNDGDKGTTATGGLSAEYCKYCFQKGRFTDEGTTLGQKMAKNIAMAKKTGVPEAQAKAMAEKILPGLKRWKKK